MVVAVVGIVLSFFLAPQFLVPAATIILGGTVLAAIIGGIIQFLSDRIGEARTSQQLVLQNRLSSIKSIWEKADKYMTDYYFPLAGAAYGLSQWIRLYQKSGSDADLFSTFYWYNRFRAVAVKMSRVSLYLILTSYKAERCAESLIYRILGGPAYTDLEMSTLNSALPDLSLYELQKLIEKDVNINALASKFTQWAKSKSTELDKLRKEAEYFHSIIEAEVNALYEPWYGEKHVPAEGQALEDIAQYLGLA